MHGQSLIPRRTDEQDVDFFRRVSHTMTRRATEQLHAGQNPEQAAMLAAEYAAKAADCGQVAAPVIGQTEARELLHTLEAFIADHEASGFYCAGLTHTFIRARNIVFHIRQREQGRG